ncbi:hypothetical protein [Pseudomonas sp. NCCP-436]|nr:hypothetical protein [Pseudomonas sp. NCCP-436]
MFLFFDIFAKSFQIDQPRREQLTDKERQQLKARRLRRNSGDRLR